MIAGAAAITDDNIHEFYIDSDPLISEQARAIFTEYSGIAEDEIVPHVKSLREKAWAHFNYPCIGRYGFLDFAIGDAPGYSEILAQVKAGAQILDLGCCFGQDIRKLVHDGAPSENITASDLDPKFIDLGYELFRDKDKLKSTFKTGDFFAPDKVGLQDGTFDFVHASFFFHLFSWDEQVDAVSRCLKLLRQRPGSILFGRQSGTYEPGNVKQIVARSGETYKHSEKSFAKLLRQTAEDEGIEVDIDVTQEEQRNIMSTGLSTWLNQKFTVRLL